MPTDLEKIASIKSDTLTALAALAADAAAGTYALTYTVNGKNYNWTEYQTMLRGQLDWCNEMLSAEDPAEVVSYIL